MYSSLFSFRNMPRFPPDRSIVFMRKSSSLNSLEGVMRACFFIAEEAVMPKSSTSLTMLSDSFVSSPYSLKLLMVLNIVIGGTLELAIVAMYDTANGSAFLMRTFLFLDAAVGYV